MYVPVHNNYDHLVNMYVLNHCGHLPTPNHTQ